MRSRSTRSAPPPPKPSPRDAARRARHPRRLGSRSAGTRKRGRARRDTRLRQALGAVPAHHTEGVRARPSGCRLARWATRRSGTSRSDRVASSFQDLMRVNVAIEDGSLFTNDALLGAFRRARERGGSVHLLGLVSHGGVHSHIDHLRALLNLAASEDLSIEDLDPRIHRRPRRLAPIRRDGSRRASPRPHRDRVRALLRDGSRQSLGKDRSRVPRDLPR